MKKLGLLMVVSAFFLVSCGSKDNKTAVSSTDSSTSESQKMTDSSSSKSTESTQVSSTTMTTSKESKASQTQTTQAQQSQTETTTVASSTTSTPSSSSEVVVQSDPLSGYTNDQIEFARVWLAVMGTHYKADLAKGEFELHATRSAAGAPVNPYDANSLTYPNETITLSGKYGYQSLIVYSSNHNGSITCYPTPSHFQEYRGDQEATRNQEQEILNQASIVSIPTGNPEDVKELIAVLKIDN